MSEDDATIPKPELPPTTKPPATTSAGQWFTTPKPIKRLFNQFPLQTLPANELPLRTAQNRDQHTLYVFTTEEAARHGEPSFNPSCLKWQTYLKFLHLPFQTRPSNNHASPTGALPFLLPATTHSTTSPNLPVPSSKLQKWTREQKISREEPSSLRYEAYTSLLDHRIRNAWLYTLYLTRPNFTSVAHPLYISPATTSPPVRLTLSHHLRAAATSELRKSSSSLPFALIDPDSLYRDADAAFSALSALLGDDAFFFGAAEPGLMDASVFAYTHLLLDEEMGWRETRLVRCLWQYGNLVRHRRRVYKGYFGGGRG